ncbi:hypothetical protein Csa_023986, partial [Cucumis sativus]
NSFPRYVRGHIFVRAKEELFAAKMGTAYRTDC